ncbi:MAG: transporter substrate-binding domain-containing protein [Synergistaceae bacterium]|nr:transporter substrate-binding domain-containing protein [Synergistaceae bacterium]
MSSSPTFAANNDDYVGFLTRLKTTPEEFFMLMKTAWSTTGWVIEGGDHSTSKARFYDSLIMMQMALNAGEINEMILPDFVAEHLLKLDKRYAPSCISNSGPMNLCFGFLKENQALANKWNFALNSMRNDYTLAGLEQKYIKNFPEDSSYDYIYGINENKKRNQNKIKFEYFKDAPAIRVAVTGDLPPVDFVAEDGLPAGYSTAVLAEIGKRLHLNIKLVQVNAGARTAALVSERVEVVFWYEVHKNSAFQPDVNEDIILSEPYLSWNKFIHLQISSED